MRACVCACVCLSIALQLPFLSRTLLQQVFRSGKKKFSSESTSEVGILYIKYSVVFRMLLVCLSCNEYHYNVYFVVTMAI